MKSKPPVIGLALGCGSARGWAHIGIIKELAAHGIEPAVVAGCSIGALVGAVYVDGKLDGLESWSRKLDHKGILQLLDVSLAGGMLRGERVIEFFRKEFWGLDFADLSRPFGVVATDFESGEEVWIREGGVADAVRASIATPFLFRPVVREGRVLVDGGLVDPVPVTLCRSLGADIVIAVDLVADKPPGRAGKARPGRGNRSLIDTLLPRHAARTPHAPALPSLYDIVDGSIHIMQVHIARNRLQREPADILITPRLGSFGLMDYYRADEAIAEGRAAVQRMLPQLQAACAGDLGDELAIQKDACPIEAGVEDEISEEEMLARTNFPPRPMRSLQEPIPRLH
jgi:NTE family protein